MAAEEESPSRRDVLRSSARSACLLGLGGLFGTLASRDRSSHYVWQIDPTLCMSCGGCATRCVLPVSAVKCVHAYEMCGYCELCTGFFEPAPAALDEGAENQLCPLGALKRKFVEEPYFEYEIEEELCVGCGKCVEGCVSFGNGSLFLQVRHDRCLNCNECSIALACPTQAYRRVPADRPYLLKGKASGT